MMIQNFFINKDYYFCFFIQKNNFMEKTWIFKKKHENKYISDLKKSLNIDEILANLLYQRGIKTFDEAKKFFRPNLKDLYSPFLMKDMDLAVKRIEKAIENKEKILIYGDYDVDGTTSVALVYSFFKEIYNNLDYYIPDRYTEGYGISYQSINFAVENKFSLVIALDCGIKAIEKINYANKNNLDFIICDHHETADILPEAVAILDAKRSDCNYPFKELSGCGVSFKLIQAFSEKNNFPFENLIKYLDLVVVSIASDIVQIIDENRILAYFGLKQLNENPSVGLKKIIKIAGLKNKEINISDIVFRIGPRINAAGRIDKGKKATHLLTETNEKKAEKICYKIDDFNVFRKNLDTNITKEALHFIKEDLEFHKKKTTVLYDENWNKGVIGIVASRLIETHYRPTVILTKSDDGIATASARSVDGFDLYSAMEKCSDLFIAFGGHKYAAGLTLEIKNIPIFKERFEKIVAETITEEQLKDKIEIDMKINFDDITPKFFRILKQFSPFGPENKSPVFASTNIFNWGNAKNVGKKKEHIKLYLGQFINKKLSNNFFNSIGFGMGNYLSPIKKDLSFHICYSVIENSFQDRKSLELNLKDIKIIDIENEK